MWGGGPHGYVLGMGYIRLKQGNPFLLFLVPFRKLIDPFPPRLIRKLSYNHKK